VDEIRSLILRESPSLICQFALQQAFKRENTKSLGIKDYCADSLPYIYDVKPSVLGLVGIKNGVDYRLLEQIKQIMPSPAIVTLTDKGIDISDYLLLNNYSDLIFGPENFDTGKITSLLRQVSSLKYRLISSDDRPLRFTLVESQFLKLFALGKTRKEIAVAMKIGRRRVQDILDQLKAKIEVSTSEQVLIYAIRTGWGEP
jgi:DNA-binding CsgD family transcriptional regulator